MNREVSLTGEQYRDLYRKVIDNGGSITFTKKQPEVSAYLEDGEKKGFGSKFAVVKVWDMYLYDTYLMLHVFDHADNNMHSTNIDITNISGAGIDEIKEVLNSEEM